MPGPISDSFDPDFLSQADDRTLYPRQPLRHPLADPNEVVEWAEELVPMARDARDGKVLAWQTLRSHTDGFQLRVERLADEAAQDEEDEQL